jgi:uncharacterized protein (DUF1778 family)
MSTRPRTVRFRARVTPETLAVVERAAEIKGQSVSDFVITTAEAAAHRAVEQAELIRAAMQHHEAFTEAMLKPMDSTSR